MRRLAAALAAACLTVLLAGSVLAAPAAGRPNSFYGNFDLLEYYGTTVVAHVVATVHEPTDTQLVPGTLDIYWKTGAIRESHAQVTQAYFWPMLDDPNEGPQLGAYLYGYLCDYRGPEDASCQPFAIDFVKSVNTAYPNHVGFQLGSGPCCDGPWYDVGSGAFAMNWVRATP